MRSIVPFIVLVSNLVTPFESVFSQSTGVCPQTANACVQFDGIDDRTVCSAPQLDSALLVDFTFECWIKVSQPNVVSGNGAVGALVGKWGLNGALSFQLSIDAAGTVTAEVQNYIFLPYAWAPSSVSIVDAAWHHIAVSQLANSIALVVDGVLQMPVYTNSLPADITSDTRILFGQDIVGAKSFAGDIDEVRMWGVSRSVAEIAGSKNSGLLGSEAGLIGYWRLDEGSGQLLHDSTILASNGTLGINALPGADDPQWSASPPSPIAYCASGGLGQANGTLASLQIDGIGPAGSNGPFTAAVASGAVMTLTWHGPANQPLILAGGPLNPTITSVNGLGSVGIGTPPVFADVFIIFDGTEPPLAPFFRTDALGNAQQAFTLALPPGPLVSVQGLVSQPSGTTLFGVLLTAAFTIVIQ